MFDDSLSPDPATATAELQAKVDRLDGVACGDCGRTLCGHQALFAIALGTHDRPLCSVCLARSLGRSSEELRDHLWQHFRHRDCYGTVWNTVTQREERREDGLPSCLWSAAPSQASERREPPGVPSPAPIQRGPDSARSPELPRIEWDAGELACGELLLELRLRLRSLAPGSVIVLTSQDRGAIEDIPAWCRLTGHRLLSVEHPRYFIERKPT